MYKTELLDTRGTRTVSWHILTQFQKPVFVGTKQTKKAHTEA